MAKLETSKKLTAPKIAFFNCSHSTRFAVYEEMSRWSQQYNVEYALSRFTAHQLIAQLPTPEHNTQFALTWNPLGVHYLEYRIVEWL